MTRGRFVRIVLAVMAALVIGAVLFRHALVTLALERGISVATGYDVVFGDHRLGGDRGALLDVHVRKNGEPVIDAARVDVGYSWRDLFPGGRHRFGLLSVAIARPTLTIIRHADGTFNLTAGGSSVTPPEPPGAAKRVLAPYAFTARLRNGTVNVIDRSRTGSDLARQSIVDVALDASVNSETRTDAALRGVYLARRVAGARVERWPLTEQTLIDYPRGFARHRVRFAALPLRGPLAFIVHTSSFFADDGVLRDGDVHADALNIHNDVPIDYHLGGGAALVGARATIGALNRPLRDAHGAISLYDDGITTRALDATLAGAQLHAQGGLYDFTGLRFRLGVRAAGDLDALRSLFGFSARLPLRGAVDVEALLASRIDKPLIRLSVAAPAIAYGRYPVRAVHAVLDYYDGAVSIGDGGGAYGPLTASVGGEFVFDGPNAGAGVVLGASGLADQIPYAQNVLPATVVEGIGIIGRRRRGGYFAHGVISAAGPHTSGGGFVAVDPRGQGEFGPFQFVRDDGSMVAGAFRLERPIGASAGWIRAGRYVIHEPARPARLPGSTIPDFPPLGGTVDVALAGGGSPDRFGLAGFAASSHAVVEGFDVGRARAHLAGSLDDVRIRDIAIDGPRGRLTGDGDVHGGRLVISGRYDGSLDAIAALTGQTGAHGPLHGPLLAVADATGLVIQTTGLQSPGARVRGIAVDGAAGTIRFVNHHLRVIAGSVSIGNAAAVAAEVAPGTVAVSALALPAADVRGTGIPLEAGRVSLFGLADLRAVSPTFAGDMLLTDGIARGYAVAGSARIDYTPAAIGIRAGAGSIGDTFGFFDGRLAGAGRDLRYDLGAHVPVADIATAARDVRRPVRYLDGSFSADLHIGGRAADPAASGQIRVPEGSYNGLAFHNGAAHIGLSARSLAASEGSVTVGSTIAQFSGSRAGEALAVSLRSKAVDLADFNDYFDASDTLAGRGRIDLALTASPAIVTHGDIALGGLRFRNFPIGSGFAHWSMAGRRIALTSSMSGLAGSVQTSGTIGPAAVPLPSAIRAADYDLAVAINGVDLATWLPAVGMTAPVLGRAEATARVRGRFPTIETTGTLALAGGEAGPYAIDRATAAFTARGERITIGSAALDLGFVRFNGAGTLGLLPQDPLNFNIQATAADAGLLLHQILPKRTDDLGGSLDVDLRINGSWAKPRVVGGLDLEHGRYASLAVPRVLANFATDLRSFEIRDASFSFARGSAFVAGSLPIIIYPPAIGPVGAPLSVNIEARSVDLAPFAPFFPGRTVLSGTMNGRLALEGTAGSPRVLGTASLAGGSYVSAIESARIRNVNAELSFNGTSVGLEALHADVGTGTLVGRGRLDLPIPNAPRSGYTVALTAAGAQLNFPGYGGGAVDGSLQVRSGQNYPTASGALTLHDATIPFAALYRSGGGGGSATGGTAGLNVGFNIVATAGKNVRIRSPIIDVGAVGSVDLTGTLRSPRLAGEFTATSGGVFSTYQRAFRIQSATVTFDPNAGIVPNVDLRATAHVSNPDPDPSRNAIGSADITVAVSGPADAFNVDYSSNPPYSQSQIVGLLVDAPFLGAVNFNSPTAPGDLRGAPRESNVLLPPGVQPYQNATFSLNQEAFSLLNTQLTQRFIAPLETFFGGAFGLTDLELTVDYGGRIGYNARRQIGKKDVYVNLGQVLTYPSRTQVGFEARPDAATSVSFSYYQQQGVPAYAGFGNFSSGSSFSSLNTPGVLNGIQALSNREGFQFNITRRYP